MTCGPGYTQIMTALVMAARGNGVPGRGVCWRRVDRRASMATSGQIDQAPLALATGAHFVPIRTIDRALDCVREASLCRTRRKKAVVLSVPLDLQKEEFPYLPDYTPSTDLIPRRQVLRPDLGDRRRDCRDGRRGRAAHHHRRAWRDLVDGLRRP